MTYYLQFIGNIYVIRYVEINYNKSMSRINKNNVTAAAPAAASIITTAITA